MVLITKVNIREICELSLEISNVEVVTVTQTSVYPMATFNHVPKHDCSATL